MAAIYVPGMQHTCLAVLCIAVKQETDAVCLGMANLDGTRPVQAYERLRVHTHQAGVTWLTSEQGHCSPPSDGGTQGAQR